MTDMTDLTNWIGNQETRKDHISANLLAAWSSTLDREDAFPEDGTDIPAGFHWTLFPPLARQSELGEDGHPRKGGFLPPISLPRRMWAGSRMEFLHPLHVGEDVVRHSTIIRIDSKSGRSGNLIFVTIKHEFKGPTATCLIEEQDIVYRDAPSGPVPDVAGDPAPRGKWFREVNPTESQLFRYSALTFNAHRIHYDLPYATNAEGYPGLVVHGPLLATLLLDHLRATHAASRLLKFSFRAVRPTYLLGHFTLNADPGTDASHIKLWSTDNRGRIGMEASAEIA